MSTVSCVRPDKGVPALFINGARVPACAYITYFTGKNHYDDFAAAGYRLYSMPVFFATRTINEEMQFPPFSEGIFEKKGAPDFSRLERDVEQILAACPDAYIFPRVNVSEPTWWDEDNPDELCDFCYTAPHRACFSSEKWLKDTEDMLDHFLDYCESAPWRDRIVGYQISGGNTEEWISFDNRGSVGKRSREAFTGKGEKEYNRFLSEMVARAVVTLCGHVKRKTTKVAGAFYGYTFELTDPLKCHHALNTVLASPDVDFICSPVSYRHLRAPGFDHANMTPLDSLKEHGKLYFAENDTRTDLSKAPLDDHPYYSGKIWQGPPKETAHEVLMQHFARALCHGHAFWWFDMWGGWYAREDYMAFMKRAKEICSDFVPAASTAQVAVFTDERAGDALMPGDTAGDVVQQEFRTQLGLSGVPYDVFLIDDFPRVVSRYRAAVFLEPVSTEDVENAKAHCPCPYLCVTPENADLTTDELRAFYRQAGVDVWLDRDAIVYENETYRYVSFNEDGRLHLPDGRWTDLFTGEASDTFPMKQFRGRLLRREK